MVEALVMGSKIALLGIPLGKSPVNWSWIVFKAITVKGIYSREMIAMLQNGLDFSHLVTHQFGVADFARGVMAMKSGRSGKAARTRDR